MSWVQRGQDIDGEASGDQSGHIVSLSSDGLTLAISAITNDGTVLNSDRGHVRIYSWNGTNWIQKGQDIDGEALGDWLGYSCMLNSDGTVVCMGGIFNDAGGDNRGHVRVYSWNGSNWVQRGQDIDGVNNTDYFGASVALDSTGTILAVGSNHNDSGGTSSGQVRVFSWNGSSWVQRGQNINGETAGDESGWSVSLSSNGSILAIGAHANDGTVVNSNRGHVRVFRWSGSSWIQRGQDIDGEASNDKFGWAVSLSSDGLIVAIGSIWNDGAVFNSNIGHVRVFAWNGSSWVQRGQDIDGQASNDQFGRSLSLSSDGSILAIGSEYNDGNGTDSGRVSVYYWNGSSWIQQGLHINGEAANDYLGKSVSLSSNGSILAIGGSGNDGNGTNSGHVRVYTFVKGKKKKKLTSFFGRI